MEPGQAKLKIQVFDLQNRRVTAARVEVTDERKKTTRLNLNEATGLFETVLKAPGRYSVRVALKEHESQTRQVQAATGEHEEVFMLGKKGMPFYYRGRVKVPFEPRPDQFGVVLKEPLSADKYVPELEALARRYKLERVKGGDNLRRNGLYIYRIPQAIPSSERAAIQESIRKHEFVYLCAPILKLFDQNATLLTDGIIVKFRSGVGRDQAVTIAKRLALELVRNIPYAGNAYQFRAGGPISYGLLDICVKLLKTDLVEYAEPDLWHTAEDDQINPTDWLFPEQWDHPIIGTPNAWQTLANINAARTFGESDVIVAVVDSGIDAAHPAFAGNVGNGAAKVYQLFDFVNMVANNNALGGVEHGTCCAGAAIGSANDASPVAGTNEGIAGIAGNCRVIGIRRSGPETTYADLYVWAAGFNPNSALANFPAQINPGADIITNSFGFSIGNPISGLMRDTFDFLATYGRGGKGALLFFSAGNNGGAAACTGADGTLLRPWGMYQKCISVTASTLNNAGAEVKASYSNFGPNVSFCAPSGGNCTGRHNPPNTYGAFTPTIRGQGNTPGHPAVQTTLNNAAVAGANAITIANTAGMAGGQAVLIGNPGAAGTEARLVNAVNAGANQLTVGNLHAANTNLFNAHAAGTNVAAAPADYIDNFGGTSYSTPVCAGVAALMLSASRNLTWMEVRELIRDSAVKIDPNNTDATGRWRDRANRISTDPAYTGPFFSQWYGYGRIDAAVAVTAAANYGFQRDILIRDNLADTGLAPSTGVFWEGVDIWVRNANDNVAPANYATHANTVHQAPIFGQANWVYVRFRNIGTLPSFPFFVRVYVTHWAGTEFVYPDNFIPSVRPSDPLPTPLTPGTYLIGEAAPTSLAAGSDGRVAVEWAAALVPPETAAVRVNNVSTNVRWHPCLLVEVTPHDGFTPTGNHIRQNNNLAQKNISIVYPDSASGDFAFAGVVGNLKNRSKFIGFEIGVKWPVPRSAPFYIRFLNRHVETCLIEEIRRSKRRDLKAESSKQGTLFHLIGKGPVKLQLPNVGTCAFIVGGNVKALPRKAKVFVQILQFDDSGRPSGGLSLYVAGKGK